MYVFKRHLVKITFLAFLFTSPLYAAQGSLWNNVVLSGSGGWNWINTDNTHLDISAYETDSLRVESTTVDGAWKAGIGYFMFNQRVLTELNVYGVSNTVKGDVWQYELSQFNNYTFSAPISSTRLMFDVKPNLITWHKITPYLILGVGASWNTASYKEKSDPGIASGGARTLSDNTQAQLAWDVGAGVSYELTHHLSLTAEYVYGFLGNATPDDNASVLEAPEFSYQIQSLLFGLRFKL